MDNVRKHVVITGRVQGVWFRARTQEEAESLGVTGWVRNLPDGSVEAVFEGEVSAVAAVVKWCGKGPPHAIVDSVSALDESPQGLTGFHVTG